MYVCIHTHTYTHTHNNACKMKVDIAAMVSSLHYVKNGLSD